uniref:Tho2 domain-containing protein n=1 Tax=Rhabditophanes sp. KR3021 TaxID=114890 RepID=A0AC35TRG6_9BILA
MADLSFLTNLDSLNEDEAAEKVAELFADGNVEEDTASFWKIINYVDIIGGCVKDLVRINDESLGEKSQEQRDHIFKLNRNYSTLLDILEKYMSLDQGICNEKADVVNQRITRQRNMARKQTRIYTRMYYAILNNTRLSDDEFNISYLFVKMVDPGLVTLCKEDQITLGELVGAEFDAIFSNRNLSIEKLIDIIFFAMEISLHNAPYYITILKKIANISYACNEKALQDLIYTSIENYLGSERTSYTLGGSIAALVSVGVLEPNFVNNLFMIHEKELEEDIKEYFRQYNLRNNAATRVVMSYDISAFDEAKMNSNEIDSSIKPSKPATIQPSKMVLDAMATKDNEMAGRMKSWSQFTMKYPRLMYLSKLLDMQRWDIFEKVVYTSTIQKFPRFVANLLPNSGVGAGEILNLALPKMDTNVDYVDLFCVHPIKKEYRASSLKKEASVSSMLSTYTRLFDFAGPYLGKHERVIQNLLLIFTNYLKKNMGGGSEEKELIKQIISSCIIPGATFVRDKEFISRQLSILLNLFPSDEKDRMYEKWNNSDLNDYKEMVLEKNKVEGIIAYYEKRITKENCKGIVYEISPFIERNPYGSLVKIVQMIQKVDAMMPFIVDALATLTDFTLDVIGYALTEYICKLTTKKTESFIPDLKCVAHFIGLSFSVLGYNISNLLNWIQRRLISRDAYVIYILREIIVCSSGSISVASLNEQQIKALNGGPVIQRMYGCHSSDKVKQKALENLKDCLIPNELFLQYIIGILCNKQELKHSRTTMTKEVSVESIQCDFDLADVCQDVYNQYYTFLRDNFMPHIKDLSCMPTIDSIIDTYVVDHYNAWSISRLVFWQKVNKNVALEHAKERKDEMETGEVDPIFEKCYTAELAVIIECVKNTPMLKNMLKHIPAEIYCIFWLGTSLEYAVPDSLYKAKIQELKADKSTRFEDDGRRKNGFEEDTGNKVLSLDNELKRLKINSEQIKHCSGAILSGFLNSYSMEELTTFYLKFYDHCIFPRSIQSRIDAHYIYVFFSFLKSLDKVNFNFLRQFKSFFATGTNSIAFLTEEECINYGCMLNEAFQFTAQLGKKYKKNKEKTDKNRDKKKSSKKDTDTDVKMTDIVNGGDVRVDGTLIDVSKNLTKSAALVDECKMEVPMEISLSNGTATNQNSDTHSKVNTDNNTNDSNGVINEEPMEGVEESIPEAESDLLEDTIKVSKQFEIYELACHRCVLDGILMNLTSKDMSKIVRSVKVLIQMTKYFPQFDKHKEALSNQIDSILETQKELKLSTLKSMCSAYKAKLNQVTTREAPHIRSKKSKKTAKVDSDQKADKPDVKDHKEAKDAKDSKDAKEAKEGKSAKDAKEPKEAKKVKEAKVDIAKEVKDGSKESKDTEIVEICKKKVGNLNGKAEKLIGSDTKSKETAKEILKEIPEETTKEKVKEAESKPVSDNQKRVIEKESKAPVVPELQPETPKRSEIVYLKHGKNDVSSSKHGRVEAISSNQGRVEVVSSNHDGGQKKSANANGDRKSPVAEGKNGSRVCSQRVETNQYASKWDKNHVDSRGNKTKLFESTKPSRTEEYAYKGKEERKPIQYNSKSSNGDFKSTSGERFSDTSSVKRTESQRHGSRKEMKSFKYESTKSEEKFDDYKAKDIGSYSPVRQHGDYFDHKKNDRKRNNDRQNDYGQPKVARTTYYNKGNYQKGRDTNFRGD